MQKTIAPCVHAAMVVRIHLHTRILTHMHIVLAVSVSSEHFAFYSFQLGFKAQGKCSGLRKKKEAEPEHWPGNLVT